MSKSCSPSAVWRRIKRRSGVGFNVTAPNWNSGCAVSSSRPNKSWRVNETYIREKGRWCYSTGPSIPPVPPSTFCCRRCALPLRPNACSKMRSAIHRIRNPGSSTPIPAPTASAIAAVKEEGTLRRRCRHRLVQYLNNILEQDHRAIKRRVKAKQGFREFRAAWRTMAGYEPMHMIRKGQARWLSDDDVRQRNQFIDRLFDLSA
jgi:IS6 family transposase